MYSAVNLCILFFVNIRQSEGVIVFAHLKVIIA